MRKNSKKRMILINLVRESLSKCYDLKEKYKYIYLGASQIYETGHREWTFKRVD